MLREVDAIREAKAQALEDRQGKRKAARDAGGAAKALALDDRQAKGKVARRECCFLVDDRRENVQAIDEAGYTGIHVDYRKGITRSHALDILARLTACAQEHGNSGLRPDAVVEGPNLPGPR